LITFLNLLLFFGNKSSMMDFQCLQVHYNDSHNQHRKFNRCFKVFFFFPMKKWKWDMKSKNSHSNRLGHCMTRDGKFFYIFLIFKGNLILLLFKANFEHIWDYFSCWHFLTPNWMYQANCRFPFFCIFFLNLAKLILKRCLCCTFEQ